MIKIDEDVLVKLIDEVMQFKHTSSKRNRLNVFEKIIQEDLLDLDDDDNNKLFWAVSSRFDNCYGNRFYGEDQEKSMEK